MKKRIGIVFLFALFAFFASAQDLNVRVQLISSQIQNSNKRTFDELEGKIRDFLNNRKWSTDNFQPQERLDCSLVINITGWDGSSSYKTEAQIQSSRPVYGTSYNSTLLNISDKDFNFSYAEGQPLDYSDQNFTNNLSSLLAYYAYVMLGLDYDSFILMGGTSYYAKAQNVVNTAQGSTFPGWKAFEGLRNRYWLAENLNNKVYTPIREILYDYHRNGLDIMSENPAKARKEIIGLLPKVQTIDKQQQSMLNQLFFTAKADELVNIVSMGDPQEKSRAFTVLSQIDPANITKYEVLKNQK